MGQEVEIQEFPIRAGCPLTFLSGKGPLCPVQGEKWHPASACGRLIPKGQKRRRGGGERDPYTYIYIYFQLLVLFLETGFV